MGSRGLVCRKRAAQPGPVVLSLAPPGPWQQHSQQHWRLRIYVGLFLHLLPWRATVISCAVGKRSEKVLSALKSAFPAGRLLLLPSSAVQGASSADKAASVAASLVEWYLGQEEVQRVGPAGFGWVPTARGGFLCCISAGKEWLRPGCCSAEEVQGLSWIGLWACRGQLHWYPCFWR